jgi:hypothetical protein
MMLRLAYSATCKHLDIKTNAIEKDKGDEMKNSHYFQILAKQVAN